MPVSLLYCGQECGIHSGSFEFRFFTRSSLPLLLGDCGKKIPPKPPCLQEFGSSYPNLCFHVGGGQAGQTACKTVVDSYTRRMGQAAPSPCSCWAGTFGDQLGPEDLCHPVVPSVSGTNAYFPKRAHWQGSGLEHQHIFLVNRIQSLREALVLCSTSFPS